MTNYLHCLALMSLLLASSVGADDSIRIIAHRGGVVSDAVIENNLTAIEAASCALAESRQEAKRRRRLNFIGSDNHG